MDLKNYFFEMIQFLRVSVFTGKQGHCDIAAEFILN